MTRFIVWFDQINRDIIEVDADDAEQARKKALRLWKLQNPPEVGDIKEVK